jgi:LacI family transcriptional regulator
MNGWRGDGILIAANEAAELRIAKQWGIPAVNLATGLKHLYGIPRVAVDNYAAGRMAAEHLLENGLTQLAFFGLKLLWYSEQRCRGFKDRADEAGVPCHVLIRPWSDDQELDWIRQITVLTGWLRSLPIPCGIFAAQDFKARLLLDACCETRLQVPDDIAIIGMDNNETLCEHSIPRLTSISRNSVRVGYEAAALLHRLIRGEPAAGQEILIPPDRIVARESSDMLYCADPLVRQAIEYMREHLRGSYNMETLAGILGVSKRKLERNFALAAGCAPHRYLTRLRIRHAQALMQMDPGKNMETVAAECGFGSSTTFSTAFQRTAGQKPSAYRAKMARTTGQVDPGAGGGRR